MRFYASATPFSHADHKLFIETMEKTRPGLNYDKLHFNRKTVAGTQLDTEYDEERQPMNEKLNKAKELVLLTEARQTDRHEKTDLSPPPETTKRPQP